MTIRKPLAIIAGQVQELPAGDAIAASQVAAGDHNLLSNLQGGAASDYYHLTSAQLTDLTGSGDSTLHYHASDRSLANTTGLGTGIGTALAIAVGSAGAPVLFDGAGGTPSSLTLTNATGLPAVGVTGTALVSAAIGTTVQAYDADLTTWAGITPGANVGTALAVAVGTDGAFVVKGGALGTPSSGTVTNLTGTASININGTVGDATPASGSFTTIKSSGDVLLKATAKSSNKSTVDPSLTISGAGVVGSAQIVRHTTVGVGGALLEMSSTRGTSNTSYTILQSGDGVGTLNFSGVDGNELVPVASIIAAVDGTPGDNDMPGRLVFSTTADGASTTTERMRIGSNGYVLIGSGTDISASSFSPAALQISGTTNPGVAQVAAFSNGNVGPKFLFTKSRGTTVGSYTVVANNDNVGEFTFTASDGTDAVSTVAYVAAYIDGTPGANDTPGRLVFGTTPDGSAIVTDRMVIDSTGLITISSGQIKFPATQNPSTDVNTLDDYEEGSWVPSFGGFSVAPTGGTGTYIKIGKLVMASMHGFASGTSNATTKTVTLPFASLYSTVMAGVGHPMDNSAFSSTPCRFDTRASSTTMDVYMDLNVTAWTASGQAVFDFTIVYQASA